MSIYVYRSKKPAELRAIAHKALTDHPGARIGPFAVDIERMVEEAGIELIFRPLPSIPCPGYAARNPKYILINQLHLGFQPRYRFTVAEEFCHRLLESQLWAPGAVSEGSDSHEIPLSTYNRIEKDAKNLAGEILAPEPHFSERFKLHHETQKKITNKSPDQQIKDAIRAVGEDFDVSAWVIAKRALYLKLITKPIYQRCFSPVM